MGVIDEAMLRRRAEHNEGILHSLEELVLQEEGIMEINKALGTFCPNLKILYLPNNLIGKLGNLNRLKQLQYLNLAINNIQKVEGLHQCEALEKLDLTLNFVDTKELPSVASLKANVLLKELFLTGNPCQDTPGYRSFVIASLPWLKRLDGAEIKPSERIKAQQDFPTLADTISNDHGATSTGDATTEQHVNEKGEILRDYTPASRLAEFAELEGKKAKGTKPQKADAPQRRTCFDPLPADGRIFQKNEGGWAFKLVESECGSNLILDVTVGRYLDTSTMDVDIQPLLVRVLIRGKLLQLRLPEEVKTNESFAQRSTTSGHLVVRMPKLVVHNRNRLTQMYLVQPRKPEKPEKKPVATIEVHQKPLLKSIKVSGQDEISSSSEHVPPLE